MAVLEIPVISGAVVEQQIHRQKNTDFDSPKRRIPVWPLISVTADSRFSLSRYMPSTGQRVLWEGQSFRSADQEHSCGSLRTVSEKT